MAHAVLDIFLMAIYGECVLSFEMQPGPSPIVEKPKCVSLYCYWVSQVALMVKNLRANTGDIRDTGSILGSGRSTGEENGNFLQYSSLENPTDRGTWWAMVNGVTKSWMQLSMHAPIVIGPCCTNSGHSEKM